MNTFEPGYIPHRPMPEDLHALEQANHPPDAALMAIGCWLDRGTTWGFYLSEQPPSEAICTSAAGVAIRSLENSEVVLTLDPTEEDPSRKGRWEIPGGHVDPRNPKDPHSPLEDPPETQVREFLEEIGWLTDISKLHMFGYRLMLNPPGSRRPKIGYTPYYYAISEAGEALVPATDPVLPIAAIYPEWSMQRLVTARQMNPSELTFVQYGLAAARQRQMAA